MTVKKNTGLIRIENVSHTFNTDTGVLPVLDDLTLSVPKNGFTAIVGPSGCGKSTVTRLVAGLLKPDKGTVWLQGQKVNTPRDIVGMAFQNPVLLEWRTILQNVMLPLELKNKKDAKNIAINYLEKVGMQNRLLHYPQNLSGGEQQRVAIARAFACEAEVLFCDEPTGNLDSNNSEMIADLIFDAFQESSSALIIVTHDLSLANRCDQKIELMDGKIL